MTGRRQFSLLHVLVAVGCVAVLIGLLCASMKVLERQFWRVHPIEQAIGERIRTDLGGAYHADGSSDWHITGVWLQGTAATDVDIEKILKLQHLKHLDVSGTQVTDASLPAIFSHKTLKTLRASGSKISPASLRIALSNAPRRISLEE